MANNAAFGQYLRVMKRKVNRLSDELGAQSAFVCYRKDGSSVTFGSSSFDQIVARFLNVQHGSNVTFGSSSFDQIVARFLNVQQEAPIVALHKAVSLVQIEQLNQVEITALINRLGQIIDNILARIDP
ncbi:Uncharacterized protein Rs2_20878 [Raphanus sativus]|uniref:Uncharacterized protein LOC108858116 n=1 Tax=Raphanus sativus TaxID=3726 RepID=A0A6J0NV14_RAPSA|nr:uncharacterized protein LOC108858116 [Raphanus sativus]KAJ4894084.1 Uncharacterized protein Rs2_20878 [Raphanus sativus]